MNLESKEKWPSKELKEKTVMAEVNNLFEFFDSTNLKLRNVDALSVSFDLLPNKADFDALSKLGYKKESKDNLSVYSKWDIDSAVASNISVDETKKEIVVSLNF